MNYYNEFDPKAATWLRELIKQGLIPAGDVDERSINEVQPNDLNGYTQCHFFAGIGGWPYALHLAGWPTTEPVWTGSCPCQPLSCAGQRKGHADERHLWPAFYRIISECEPSVIFGEQVASKDGREWLAGIRADLEGARYAVGAADLCAAGVGSPHPRQRLYWVADARFQPEGRTTASTQKEKWWPYGDAARLSADNQFIGMEHSEGIGLPRRPDNKDARGRECAPRHSSARAVDGMCHAAPEGLQGQWSEYRPSGERCSGLVGLAVQIGVPQWNGPTVAIECSDGPRRASAQSDAFPLAHGVPSRMVKLRGSGNAIVPQVAAEFIQAYREAINQ